VVEVERIGNRDHVRAWNRNELAVTSIHPVAQHGEFTAVVLQSGKALHAMSAEMDGRDNDPLASPESGDVFADLDDFSGDVAAQDVRQLHARQAHADEEIEMVQRAGAHPHQNMVLAQLRLRDVFVLEYLGTAEFMNANCFHRALPSSRTISSVEGNGPAEGDGSDRRCSRRRRDSRRFLSSRAVGTNCSITDTTSAAMDLRFCRALLRSASSKSSGTFLTYSVAISFPRQV
jgi:hypothetical protein